MSRSRSSGSKDVDRRSGACGDHEANATVRQTLIDELESVAIYRSIGSRADVLRRVTDLFVTGSDRFDAEQRALFDDVMGRLVEEIELSARAAFGERLATITNAPPKVSRTLALDDSIEVAGPLLAHSDQLDDDTLIVGANTKSQEHLLAISRRKLIAKNVTDILVERGNQKVVMSTAANSGAQLSKLGYSTLIRRATDDDELALAVISRPEVPREHLLTLFETASETVRVKLETSDRGNAALIRDMIKLASDKIQTQARERSAEFTMAQARIEQLHQAGALTEDRLREFAKAGKFGEVTIALSLIVDLPIGAIERTLVHEHGDQVLVLAKSIGLSWDTTSAILQLRATATTSVRSPHDINQSYANFNKLRPETAQTAIQFYRLRERVIKAPLN